MINLVRAWLEGQAILRPQAMKLKVICLPVNDPPDHGSIEAVAFNDEVALVQDNWGHKPGQIAFVVYEKKGGGWDRVSNHDVEWRWPNRQPKTPQELELAYTKGFNEALVEVIATLLRKVVEARPSPRVLKT